MNEDERGSAAERGAPIALVRWGLPMSADALSGTELTVDAQGSVRLEHPLMPSGTVMQSWCSLTDYQAVRAAPTLPALRQGRSYRLVPELTATPPDSVYFEVRCCNRFNEHIRVTTLHPPSFEFALPSDCHHLEIRLRNGGCDALSFDAFSLWEVREHE